MIRSVVEFFSALFVASVGVALAALGIEVADYGSLWQLLLVTASAMVLGAVAVWVALRIFDHDYPFSRAKLLVDLSASACGKKANIHL